MACVKQGMVGQNGEIYIYTIEGKCIIIENDKLVTREVLTDSFGNSCFNDGENCTFDNGEIKKTLKQCFLIGNNMMAIQTETECLLMHCKTFEVMSNLPIEYYLCGGNVIFYRKEKGVHCIDSDTGKTFKISYPFNIIYDIDGTSWSIYDDNKTRFYRFSNNVVTKYKPKVMPFCFGKITANYNCNNSDDSVTVRIFEYRGKTVNFPVIRYFPNEYIIKFNPEFSIAFYGEYMKTPNTTTIIDNDGTFLFIGEYDDIAVYKIIES
jgi:hypothetical protein